jgi:hypothetical protein
MDKCSVICKREATQTQSSAEIRTHTNIHVIKCRYAKLQQMHPRSSSTQTSSAAFQSYRRLIRSHRRLPRPRRVERLRRPSRKPASSLFVMSTRAQVRKEYGGSSQIHLRHTRCQQPPIRERSWSSSDSQHRQAGAHSSGP